MITRMGHRIYILAEKGRLGELNRVFGSISNRANNDTERVIRNILC